MAEHGLSEAQQAEEEHGTAPTLPREARSKEMNAGLSSQESTAEKPSVLLVHTKVR